VCLKASLAACPDVTMADVGSSLAGGSGILKDLVAGTIGGCVATKRRVYYGRVLFLAYHNPYEGKSISLSRLSTPNFTSSHPPPRGELCNDTFRRVPHRIAGIMVGQPCDTIKVRTDAAACWWGQRPLFNCVLCEIVRGCPRDTV
jgi:hypothetical protein